MKKILFILFVISVSSCKKQFTCDNGEVITKGDPRYSRLIKGESVNDMNGVRLHCY